MSGYLRVRYLVVYYQRQYKNGTCGYLAWCLADKASIGFSSPINIAKLAKNMSGNKICLYLLEDCIEDWHSCLIFYPL